MILLILAHLLARNPHHLGPVGKYMTSDQKQGRSRERSVYGVPSRPSNGQRLTTLVPGGCRNNSKSLVVRVDNVLTAPSAISSAATPTLHRPEGGRIRHRLRSTPLVSFGSRVLGGAPLPSTHPCNVPEPTGVHCAAAVA
eukprot:scaffold58755_cov34-Tisochrysis_lutea.AAC.1